MDLLTIILFIIILVIGYYMGRVSIKKEYEAKLREWIKAKEEEIREDARKRSRASLKGDFIQQLAPYLPNFKYDPTEVRFIGKPIDLIVFKGISRGEPEEIVFIEVKSGKSDLKPEQRKLRDVIKEKRVRWELYRYNPR